MVLISTRLRAISSTTSVCLGGGGDLLVHAVDLADGARDALQLATRDRHLFDTLLAELLATNRLYRFLGATLYLGDDLVDFRRRVRRALGQGTNLVRDHGEAATLLTGPRRFNRRIQGQQVGLLGNGTDHLQHGT